MEAGNPNLGDQILEKVAGVGEDEDTSDIQKDVKELTDPTTGQPAPVVQERDRIYGEIYDTEAKLHRMEGTFAEKSPNFKKLEEKLSHDLYPKARTADRHLPAKMRKALGKGRGRALFSNEVAPGTPGGRWVTIKGTHVYIKD